MLGLATRPRLSGLYHAGRRGKIGPARDNISHRCCSTPKVSFLVVSWRRRRRPPLFFLRRQKKRDKQPLAASRFYSVCKNVLAVRKWARAGIRSTSRRNSRANPWKIGLLLAQYAAWWWNLEFTNSWQPVWEGANKMRGKRVKRVYAAYFSFSLPSTQDPNLKRERRKLENFSSDSWRIDGFFKHSGDEFPEGCHIISLSRRAKVCDEEKNIHQAFSPSLQFC